jgi:hypothetical protein
MTRLINLQRFSEGLNGYRETITEIYTRLQLINDPLYVNNIQPGIKILYDQNTIMHNIIKSKL